MDVQFYGNVNLIKSILNGSYTCTTVPKWMVREMDELAARWVARKAEMGKISVAIWVRTSSLQ